MKKGLKTGLGIGTLAATLVAGVFIGEAIAAQPHMQAALDDLRGARSQLNMALHDKGGHRAKAVELVNQAITETEAGIAVGAGD